MNRKLLLSIMNIFFILLLAIPSTGLLREKRNIELIALMENRVISPKPNSVVFSAKFFSEFEAWYKDRLLGRKDLIRFWSNVNGRLFDVLISREIVLGKEGFLFYPFFLNHDIVDKKEKIDTLNKINDICKENNARFTVFIVPPAEWIFPELLPEKYSPVNVWELEKTTANIFRENEIDYCFVGNMFLDLSLSERESMYYKGDYHWTPKGGYLGAQKLLSHLQLDKAINRRIEYRQEKGSAEIYTRKIGWEPIISIYDVPDSKDYNYKFHITSKIAGDVFNGFLKGANQKGEVIYENEKASNNVRVLILGDSFLEAMRNYLMQDVKTIIYSHNCDMQSPKKSIEIERMVKEYKPDIVVYEKLASFFYGHNYDAVFGNVEI